MRIRCEWVTEDPLYIAYHDREWGVPVHDDRALFESIDRTVTSSRQLQIALKLLF